MKKVFTLISALAAALAISACTTIKSTDSGVENVTGTVSYRERIALPDNARVTVTLADVSKVDAPAEVISSHAFLTEGQQIPFNYQLTFVRDEIQPNHTYAVSARIEADGKLLFITDTANRVITDEAKTLKKDLRLVKVQ